MSNKPLTIDECRHAIAVVKQEIGMREHFYPIWIREGRKGYTEATASRKIAYMQLALSGLRELEEIKDNQQELF